MLKGIALPQVLADTNGTLSCTITDQHVIRLRALGVQVVRLEFLLLKKNAASGGWHAWSDVMPLYQALVAKLVEYQVRVIGLVGNQIVPQFGQQDWDNGHTPLDPANSEPTAAFTAFLDQYISALSQVVAAFPGVRYWEIWNEPNAYTSSHGAAQGSPAGGTFIYPQLYALLLSRAAAYIRPGGALITGGLLGQNIVNLQPDSAGATYLADVLQWLQRPEFPEHRPFDAIGQHYYLDRDSLLDPYHLWAYLEYLAPLAGDTPVWITEAGWNTADDPFIQLRQADNLAMLFDQCAASKSPLIHGLCWFTLQDQPTSGDKTALFRGLYTSGMTPKPSVVPFALYHGAEPQQGPAPV